MANALKELEEIKQQFVAMVSHDLRTPLSSIRGFLELLSDGAYGELTETGHLRSALAQRNAIRLLALINDLLDFERLQSGQLSLTQSDISLSPVVTRSMMRKALPNSIKSRSNLSRSKFMRMLTPIA